MGAEDVRAADGLEALRQRTTDVLVAPPHGGSCRIRSGGDFSGQENLSRAG